MTTIVTIKILSAADGAYLWPAREALRPLVEQLDITMGILLGTPLSNYAETIAGVNDLEARIASARDEFRRRMIEVCQRQKTAAGKPAPIAVYRDLDLAMDARGGCRIVRERLG